MILRVLVGMLGVVGAVAGARGWQQPAVAVVAPTRVAVLHIGPDEAEHVGVDKGLLGVAVLPDSLTRVAEELAVEKPDIVVLRFDSRGGPVWAEQVVGLIEREFRGRFRTVAWVKRAENEAGLIALSIPEIVVTPTAVIGASPARWWPPELFAHINLEGLLECGRRVAAIGGRSPHLIRSMQIEAPLSADRVADSWVFRQDVEGARVINPRGNVLVLTGSVAAEVGVARGVAASRSELTTVLGVKDVEWVGAGVDQRLQKELERNASLSQQAMVSIADAQEAKYALREVRKDAQTPSLAVANLRRALSSFSEVEAAAPSMMQGVGTMAGVFNVRELRAWATQRVADADRFERPARVAVLNVGRTDRDPKDHSTLAANLPVSAYLKAAEELKEAGADLVVLKINEGGACGTEAFMDAVERAFRPKFRTVGWVSKAIDEGAVLAMAIPEVCMTPDGYWGAASCHMWDSKTCDALFARAAKSGGRPVALVRSIAYEGPVSVRVVDGKRVFGADVEGTVIVPNQRQLALRADSALLCGASIGTAATRDELAAVLGLKRVEWVGADIDARVQTRCEQAAAAFTRVCELMSRAVLANRALSERLSSARLSEERSRRDAAWAEMLKLRCEWPELAVKWPVCLVTSDGWGGRLDATWTDVAREVGVEEGVDAVK